MAKVVKSMPTDLLSYKKFLSTIYGRAEKLGLISNIDKTLGEIFSDIDISEPQASVSIKDLLLMRSGIRISMPIKI